MKHEQAAVVGLSYIIGFTTAFIAFGIQHETPAEEIMDSSYTATVSVPVANANGNLQVEKRNDGLYLVHKDGSDRLLSAPEEDGITGNGFYKDIVLALVSPDDNYVYYCAESSDTSGRCEHFIYSVKDDFTYKVLSSGEPLLTDKRDAMATSWLQNGDLSLPDDVVVTASEHWEVR